MLMPSIFGESLLDDFFEDPFDNYAYAMNTSNLMKTDVKDTDQGYEITMNLPGVKKEDVKAELKDGYLTISASTNSNKDEKDGNGRYIRRERYSGSCSRSFYVGEDVTQDEIKAKFENGALTLLVPKKDQKPAVEDKKYIAIEG
ncbi:MAG TPA: Hsp20/alpha crystallin family protein [Candidatus Lachnoclostridium avicola]|mgnify:CR=1 FL=1|nr:Hsp20/alpha crystallin family protein [Candidatus Lachnoclostridium avicola]